MSQRISEEKTNPILHQNDLKLQLSCLNLTFRVVAK